MGSQRKKIIQEMFEVSAKYLYRGGGGLSKISFFVEGRDIFWNYTLHLITCSILKGSKN